MDKGSEAVAHHRRHDLFVLVPGHLESRTGGYEYDRRMIVGLRDHGWSVQVRELQGTFPYPTAASLDGAASVLAAIPDGAVVMIDGLALGAMPDEVRREASRLRIVALVHLPLADEVGLDRETAARLEANERRALASAALVIVTGKTTRAALMQYGVSGARIAVVEPGTDAAPLALGSRQTSTAGDLHLLCVAAITAGKGH